jgi:O-methyltransferase involved in polyketide biosynthesis
LLAQGFDAEQPTLWLLKVSCSTCPDEQITKILAAVDGLSAPDSVMGFDCVNHPTLTSPITRAWIEMQAREGAPWLGGLDDPESYLGGLGWSVALSQPGAPDANYGRWTHAGHPLKMPDMPHNWYVMAKKG